MGIGLYDLRIEHLLRQGIRQHMHSSQRSYVLIAILGALLAVFILGLSLFSSMAQAPFHYVSATQRLPLAQIISGEILPGHPVYFFARVKDRACLLLALDGEKKYQFYLQFADERMKVSKKLVEKKSYSQAIQTAMKGQIYLGRAVQYLESEQKAGRKKDVIVYQHLLGILVEHHRMLIDAKHESSDAEKAELDKLLRYNESLHWVITGIIQ